MVYRPVFRQTEDEIARTVDQRVAERARMLEERNKADLQALLDQRAKSIEDKARLDAQNLLEQRLKEEREKESSEMRFVF